MKLAQEQNVAKGGKAAALSSHRHKVVNVLTVDVEDYYHVGAFDQPDSRSWWDLAESRVRRGVEDLLSLFAEKEIRGTFFILGWLARRYPALVRLIHQGRHEIGCHSYWHRFIYYQTPKQFRNDTRHAKQTLEDIIGVKVVSYRAPNFSITSASDWALQVLAEEGFQFDSSIFPTYHPRYGWPGIPAIPYLYRLDHGWLIECPLSVVQVCSYPFPAGGGGYFRLYPYPVTVQLLKSRNRNGYPFVTYCHPWELDATQPRIHAQSIRQWLHRLNIGATRDKLVRLINDFTFLPVAEAASHLLPQIKKKELKTANLVGLTCSESSEGAA